jgi:membrane protein implicated in regulation of membrane protease activity
MADPTAAGRYARRAGLSMVAAAVLAPGALISFVAGAAAAATVLVIAAIASAGAGVYLANMARRTAIARRNELRGRRTPENGLPPT